MQDAKIRTAVVGAGKMGTIHAKVYSQLPQSELVAVVDIDGNKAQSLADQYNCLASTDCAEIMDKIDAVTIATPTVTHLALAKMFIKKKIAVLIEKPLAANVKEGKKVVGLAKKHNTVVAVGHSERCNPVAQAIKRLNFEPKFIEANRISPYPFRSTDVGVVLDVMIHDIDIILSLAASKIKRVDAVGVNVVEEEEDICNARIVFESGCIANITASRLGLKTGPSAISPAGEATSYRLWPRPWLRQGHGTSCARPRLPVRLPRGKGRKPPTGLWHRCRSLAVRL